MIAVTVTAAVADATVTAFPLARRTARIEVGPIVRAPAHQAGVSTAALAG
jgi:hypothetical protein